MNTLNIQFEKIRQSHTVAMADRVHALKAAGRVIVGLQTGDPDFATPPAVLDAALQAMQDGLTHYAPSRGLMELRRAGFDKTSTRQLRFIRPGNGIADYSWRNPRLLFGDAIRVESRR